MPIRITPTEAVSLDLIYSSATQLANAIRTKQVSAVEVLDAQLAQIEKHNRALNAVVTLDAERARQRAHEADKALARGERWGPLHGVPFTLKDAHATAGVRTTTGFEPLTNYVPDEDGTVAARLKSAGGVLVGKTNVAAMLADPAQTSNPIFGRTNNPWDVTRTPGGSSGGAAAAVAAGMTPFEVGTDLAGSIRLPAHFCGVMGLKTTEHRVSLGGVFPGLPTPRPVRIMSCVGPIARTVDDLALMHSIIAGSDAQDTDVPPVPVDRVPRVEPKKLRIAFAPTFGDFPIATDIRGALDDAAQQLTALGAAVEQAAVPELDLSQDLTSAGQLIGMALAAFQPDRREQPATLAQYLEGLHRRDQSIVAWERFFNDWDALLCPPAMISAFPHCETGSPLNVDGRQVDYWMVSAHCTVFNYTGHPAVVLPTKLTADSLPIGVQLVGRRWSESGLLAIAQVLSDATGVFQRPTLA